MSEIRCFLGLKVEPPLLSAVTDLSARLKKELITASSIRWNRAENLHVTLFFFGSVNRKEFENIVTQTRKLTEKVKPEPSALPKKVTLKIRSSGCFPEEKRPRVLWLGVDKNRDLMKLNQCLTESMQGIGFKAEKRTYNPHVTLCRLKALDDTHLAKISEINEKLKDQEIGSMELGDFHLYESRKTEQGSRYFPVTTFSL